MLTESDLDAAIAEGIISRDQAERLLAFTRQSQGAAPDFTSRDEPFRLFRGFRDFFLALGLVILAAGLFGAVVQFYGDPLPRGGDGFTDVLLYLLAPIAILVGIAWIAGEWVTGRLRLPLSSIIVVGCLCFASGWLGAALSCLNRDIAPGDIFNQNIVPGDIFNQDIAGVVFALCALAAAILFYLRFGLPFVLLPLAAAAIGSVFLAISMFSDTWFIDNLRLITTVSGIAVFAMAMRYDMSDPNRLTRRTECGFWLHLLAAPLLVHSIIGGLSGQVSDIILILLVVLVFGFIALLIDRRAMLVSGLIYLAAAIFRTLASFAETEMDVFVMTAVVLGLIVVTLGLGWTPIRNTLMRLLQDNDFTRGLTRRLPPVSTYFRTTPS